MISTLVAAKVKYCQPFPFQRTDVIRRHFICKGTHNKKWNAWGKHFKGLLCKVLATIGRRKESNKDGDVSGQNNVM